jgi:hypothetical protein
MTGRVDVLLSLPACILCLYFDMLVQKKSYALSGLMVVIALLAAFLTGIQAVLIFMGKKGICLNDGCSIVDSFTRVSPLYFNFAGSLYFLVLSWCLYRGRKENAFYRNLAEIVLLGGIAAEGVLVFFQYVVVSTFCSYCLIVCSAVVLLNILSGPKQLLRATILFFSVFAALLSLDFKASGGDSGSLDRGSYAEVPGESGRPSIYLFFSETCPHCENVIEVLEENNSCSVRFNPVDRLKGFLFPGSTRLPSYDPSVNVNFLKRFGLDEIPVLLSREEGKTLVLKGEGRIISYLRENCVDKRESGYNGVSRVQNSGYNYLPFLQQDEEGCSVSEDCTDEKGENGQ